MAEGPGVRRKPGHEAPAFCPYHHPERQPPVRRRGPPSLFQQPRDVLELRRPRLAEDLEHEHLGAHTLDAKLGHAFEPDFAVGSRAGADGVDGDGVDSATMKDDGERR